MTQILPSTGLHRIKTAFQKTYMREQCEALMAVIDEAIEATLVAAPVRIDKLYLLDHGHERHPKHPEAQLEQALHVHWTASDCEPAVGCWHRLIAFQVSLANEQRAVGWGEIDLLGTTEHGWPIVIELKQGESDDTPATLLVQAVAYGLALQKAWPIFRAEWQAHLQQHLGMRPVLPTALNPCRLVCVAPSAYWDKWIGETLPAKTVPKGAWDALARLAEAFRVRGLEATFARVTREAPPFVVETIELPAG